MVKLQVCAAVGIPEQYYGDLETGNLATAKTVELPMQKQFQSYQAIWRDAYQDIDDVVLEHNKVPQEKWYVDMDFPLIAPEDVLQAATAMTQICATFPDFVTSPDVKQIAMMTLGVNDPSQALEQITQESKSNPDVALVKALRPFREALEKKEQQDER